MGVIPKCENSNCGPFDGSTSYLSPRPIDYGLDHTNIGLLGGSGLGNALNALLNIMMASLQGLLAKNGTHPPCRLIHVVDHFYP